jgi:uncharacterized protein
MAGESQVSFSAVEFNRFLAEKKLVGTRCEDCGSLFLPPRAICLQCHSQRLVWHEISRKGRLVAFTSIYIGPSSMNRKGYNRDNPYATGIVELEQGVKISGRLLGIDARSPDIAWIGSPVSVEFLEEEGQTFLAFSL